MSAEVHRLTPAGPIIEPESEVIEKLSHLLEKAQRGEIKGIGFFYVTGDNGTVSGWTPGCASADLMITGVSRLFHRVMSSDNE